MVSYAIAVTIWIIGAACGYIVGVWDRDRW